MLVSDERQRDDRLRQHALETDRFAAATFVLTAPITMPSAGSLLIVVGSRAGAQLMRAGLRRQG
jgi:hypothetical protein